MATQQQTYETRILLNSEQAKSEIAALEKKVETLKRKRQEALDAGDTKAWQKLGKEVDKYEAKLQGMQNRLQGINKTLDNMSAAGPKQLKHTIKDINALLNSGDIERGSSQWKVLTASLKQANTELAKIKSETKASQSAWQKFTKFLNDSWGGLTMIIASTTGLAMTIRKTVQDFAAMEEEMADVRKYTGLTDADIRELNEDLKKMDTRTAREELNQLAGAAGRLGKTSKQDILDFVEAGNMIKVALGDDLGEGAIDNVGKLAMAFGEDERMGLRGAMLATGSAINELAQNSSAKAGYLVDFTARVAGFGKQLGLTQAQLMGFGTVMDENLLQDEMAATAFGNMLTRMQTDTAKFARIAGKDVKEFADLLANDANAAVLALADSLKQADPHTMMKMLDDMGLDGSRAVAVLTTMADKIDDVRKHQQRAAEAYREGTSVISEYNTMNNTVEAGIEKAKKKFHEMSVELGEQLLPVVRYTISASSIVVNVLSTVAGFLSRHIGVITRLAAVTAAYVAVQKLNNLWLRRNVAIAVVAQALDKTEIAIKAAKTAAVKAYTVATLAMNGAISKATAAQWLLNKAMTANPIGVVVTLVAGLSYALYRLATSLDSHNMKQKLSNELATTAAKKAAEERLEIARLVEKARDENEQLDKRKEAVEKLNAIIPGYNGQLDETTGKYTENAKALERYNGLLLEKYRLEAAEDRLKDLERRKLESDLDYEERMRKSREREQQGGGGVTRWVQTQGPQAEGSVSEAAFQQQITREHEKQTAEYNKQMDIVKGIRQQSKETVDFANQFNKAMDNARQKLEGSAPTVPGNSVAGTAYESDADRKKAERERRKRDADQRRQEADEKRRLREQSQQLKAEADQRLADLAVSYSLGLTDYRSYLSDRRALLLEGIRERMKLYKEGTAEYIKLQNEEKMLLINGDDEQRRLELGQIELQHRAKRALIEAQFNDEKSELYQNERSLNDALFREDMRYLEQKKQQYREGSLERMQIEWDIDERNRQDQMQREQWYQEQLQHVRTQYLQMSDAERERMELNALDELHKQGLLKEEEYQRALLAIRAQHASGQTPDEETAATAQDMLKVAQAKAAENAQPGTSMPLIGTIQQYTATIEQLNLLYGQDEKNHAAYLEAKRQATASFCQQLTTGFQTAYGAVEQLMSAASSYYGAQADYEVAMTRKKYEKQIEAAGSNQKKVKKLQEKQQQEEAAIKKKYNRKQMKIQIAQTLAQIAINAVSAYGAALKIGPLGLTLAPIMAAVAIAAGMLQLAAIKKQQQAQEAGYYEGGFTGGRRYRREAGVVHEGEFVANHQAVENPAIRPFLNFLDQAQRNNTVSSLTPQDVSRQLAVTSVVPAVVPPDSASSHDSHAASPAAVTVQAESPRLIEELAYLRQVNEQLQLQLDDGIGIVFPMDSFDRSYCHYKQLKKRP